MHNHVNGLTSTEVRKRVNEEEMTAPLPFKQPVLQDAVFEGLVHRIRDLMQQEHVELTQCD